MKPLFNNTFFALAFIIFLASVILIPMIGNCPLFDWDEINFAECAREMVVTGDYSSVQLNFNPFWEKPPLFIWLQALSMNIFGVNEFAARFPNALCGVITLCIIYLMGKKINSPAFGLTWVLVYAGTLLPHFYFKTGIIDPWFNLFIFLSFYQLLIHFNNPAGKEGTKSALFAGFFLGIATLTKGPAAIVIVGAFIGVYWAIQRFKKISEVKYLIFFLASLTITGCSWFLVELMRGNYNVIKAFFDYQIRLLQTADSDHGGSYFYHIIVLLAGCFPTSLFLILSFKRSENDTPYQKHIKKGMILLFLVVLVIFSLLVKTKIVHYSSSCYLPITYLATYSLFKLFNGEYKIKFWFVYTFLILSVIIGLAFTLLGLADHVKPLLLKNGIIADDFARENLKASVHFGGWEWIFGIGFIIISIMLLWNLYKGKTKMVFYAYSFYVLFIMGSINTFVPKIELYSQHAAIEFYKAIADKNFYAETYAFKSYAYLFYAGKLPKQNQNEDAIKYITKKLDEMEKDGHSRITSYALAYSEWMQYGKIDRPAVFVCKLQNEELLSTNKTLTRLYAKNGFVFYVRMPAMN